MTFVARRFSAASMCATAISVVMLTAAPPPRAPLLIDAAHLARVKTDLARPNSIYTPALGELEADAKKALLQKPTSVMDKGVTPPSGDKHDYMSQAPYWWADPSKPDGRPYIRKDGVRNPEINRITDHDNLGRLCSAVGTLGLAYYFTGNTDYAGHAARMVRTWFLDPATRMNPHLKFGQGIPGINDGRGIGIIETRGLPEMLDGVILVSASPAWTAADEAGLQAWMRAYLAWLVESSYGQDESKNGNNHETWYDVQVAALASYTGQADLVRRTIEHGRERIAGQIEPDGRQPRELERTKSWDYSAFNLEAFFRLASIGERTGVDLWNYRTTDGRSLRKALDYMTPFANGERKWPHEQIGGVKLDEIRWLLRTAAVAWKDDRYRSVATTGGVIARLDLTIR